MPTILGKPPEPKLTWHYCDWPGDSHGLGSIWQCDQCGQYMFKKLCHWSDDGVHWTSTPYVKVRWYHFRLRKTIRKLGES